MGEEMRDQVPTTLALDEILLRLNDALLAERQAVADYNAQAHACDRPNIQEALETLRDVEREHALRLALPGRQDRGRNSAVPCGEGLPVPLRGRKPRRSGRMKRTDSKED